MSKTDRQERRLEALRRLPLPEPDETARRQALEAAMRAFDNEATESGAGPQASGWPQRLRSVMPRFKGIWTMDTRLGFGLGTAAVALLLLPIGYQLYSSTAFTPPLLPVAGDRIEVPADGAVTQPAQAAKSAAAPEGEVGLAAPAPVSPTPMMTHESMPMMTRQSVAAGAMADYAPAPPLGPAPAVGSGDVFTSFTDSPVQLVAEAPVSTFSIDVDTASYAYVRRLLESGQLPPADAVRVEELINYFSYDYPAPDSAEVPFRPAVTLYPTPWNPATQLLQIGLKGYEPPATADPASTLVFLLDTSGSMAAPDKLPLLKRALRLLVEQLTDNDTVAIVAYAGAAGVVLEPTPASDKAAILSALDRLAAGGSTAGAEGIALAYQLASQHRVADGINRVILATDGDFNVGIADPEELERFISRQRESGVSLSVLGFGQGNLDDATMQALAQAGNGNASYIDSFREARKVLVTEGGGTLETIAEDVKIQLEFNPAAVSEYRLIGYETRALQREDFNNDRVDAGDVGAGHQVTALYEITPAGAAGRIDPRRYGGEAAAPVGEADELAFLKLRYKLPGQSESRLLELPVTEAMAVSSLGAAGDDQRFAAAVAAFGQKLRGSVEADMPWSEIQDLARGARGDDSAGYRAEFLQLLAAAAALDPDPA